MLSNDELAAIRADIASMLPDTCNILSGTQTTDGMGGFSTTWGTAYAGVACRIDPLRGNESIAGGAVQPFHSYVMTLPYDAKVTEANRIQHGSATYAVKAIDKDKSWIASVRVIVERI